jgi:tetratricopeptide (TPR) repeat protein
MAASKKRLASEFGHKMDRTGLAGVIDRAIASPIAVAEHYEEAALTPKEAPKEEPKEEPKPKKPAKPSPKGAPKKAPPKKEAPKKEAPAPDPDESLSLAEHALRHAQGKMDRLSSDTSRRMDADLAAADRVNRDNKPGAIQNLMERGLYYRDGAEYPKALEEFEDANFLDPSDPLRRYWLAETLDYGGSKDEAAEEYVKLLNDFENRKDPTHQEEGALSLARINLGRILQERADAREQGDEVRTDMDRFQIAEEAEEEARRHPPLRRKYQVSDTRSKNVFSDMRSKDMPQERGKLRREHAALRMSDRDAASMSKELDQIEDDVVPKLQGSRSRVSDAEAARINRELDRAFPPDGAPAGDREAAAMRRELDEINRAMEALREHEPERVLGDNSESMRQLEERHRPRKRHKYGRFDE